MERIKKIIETLFNDKIMESSKTLQRREFISKQIKLLEVKLKLLSFLGKKNVDSFQLSIPTENLKITYGHSSKGYIIILSENFEKFETYEGIIN